MLSLGNLGGDGDFESISPMSIQKFLLSVPSECAQLIKAVAVTNTWVRRMAGRCIQWREDVGYLIGDSVVHGGSTHYIYLFTQVWARQFPAF